MLIIDTPGHESFSNLRTRGSSLCDVAVLIVNITHGLEPQTIESINILKNQKTPFVIALNKIDRIYQWKSIPDAPVKESLQIQTPEVMKDFQGKMDHIIDQFSQQGLKVKPYYDNKDFQQYLPIVPTSAMTGEGIPDLLLLLVVLAQKFLPKTLVKQEELQCTVLEVKVRLSSLLMNFRLWKAWDQLLT